MSRKIFETNDIIHDDKIKKIGEERGRWERLRKNTERIMHI